MSVIKWVINASYFASFAGKKLSKQEDLKEMGDISSGMSSSIMQLYLKQVLEAFFHTQSSVRHFALNVIALTLNQGLIHPVQVRHEKYFSNTFLTQHWTHRLRPYISISVIIYSTTTTSPFLKVF